MFDIFQRPDGFLSIERFQSLADPDKMLLLSFWRDEEAIRQWRNLPNHRQAQGNGRGSDGRDGMFRDYRLRIAEVGCVTAGPSGRRRRQTAGKRTLQPVLSM
jgi:heme-degrading monooxygenase HmoA